MPTLSNSKWELFAQAVAKGAAASVAYKDAGYGSDGNAAEAAASRLLRNVKVRARIAELQERGAIRAEITIAGITESLLRIADKAEKLADSAGLSVAKSAWVDAAKVNGLIIDRAITENVNTNYVVSGDPVDNVEDWEAEHAPKH